MDVTGPDGWRGRFRYAALAACLRLVFAHRLPRSATITATTANLDPAGQDLKFNILRWSSEDDRQAVIDVLTRPTGEEGADSELSSLLELPSLGAVWLSGSGLGYSLKYAHRFVTPDGGEHLTFVTGRRLGTFGRAPWTLTGAPETSLRAFTVLELRLDSSGGGEGKMSVGADIEFDTERSTVALENYNGAPVLLESVRRQPPPYSAR